MAGGHCLQLAGRHGHHLHTFASVINFCRAGTKSLPLGRTKERSQLEGELKPIWTFASHFFSLFSSFHSSLGQPLRPCATKINLPFLFLKQKNWKFAQIVDDYVYRLCKFHVKNYIFEFLVIFKLTHTLAWKHTSEAPMFPNFKPIKNSSKLLFTMTFKKSWWKLPISSTRRYFISLCDNSNVSYHKNGGHLGP